MEEDSRKNVPIARIPAIKRPDPLLLLLLAVSMHHGARLLLSLPFPHASHFSQARPQERSTRAVSAVEDRSAGAWDVQEQGRVCREAGAKRGSIPREYPRRTSLLSPQRVFPPPTFLIVVVVVVDIAVVDARTVAMLGPSSGSVSVWASVGQDASATVIVGGTGKRDGGERGRRCGRG
ncbi:hypothetical protein HETIRDRAFT_452601 [Heterobasidion irregulare TC 32-1]|uniref:Uncharacterized protein n=1 Tax=Heterobasidion irregulare (strain TC 32-1) TaxID=747525 RepID=W4K5Z4_HETIT|nr:uncharacterized protein HETIRDRAFT_452601 [Heterobasidion irregulare TC 32-1]ETW81227.1 hypothetical protein HETIRDRAFT_452601 [Heterobasidion irregulare TC 32-1]